VRHVFCLVFCLTLVIISEMRCSFVWYWQIKSVELQLEEEHEDKQKLIRDKRDLERRIQLMSEQKPTRDRG